MSEQVYTRDEIIGVILPLLKKYRAEGAILFGSYARQEANAQSDRRFPVRSHRRL